MVSKQQKILLVPDKQYLSSKARITRQKIGLEIFFFVFIIIYSCYLCGFYYFEKLLKSR